MNLKPVHDKIIVKPMDKKEETKTDSGIILPDVVDSGKLLEGEVMAAGNVIYSTTGDSIPIVVEVGNKILYSKHAQTHEYGDYIIMSQNEVLSIIKD